IAFAETKAEHEVILIDLSVPRPEWYLKDINPYGQVPSLKINDKDILFESLVIAEYLAELYPEAGLIPSDPLQRAKSRYLIQHWANHIQPVQNKAAYTLNNSEASKYREELIVELEKVNDLLLKAPRTPGVNAEGPYYLGEKFTWADLAIAPFLSRAFLLTEFNENKEITAEQYPQLKRFFEWKAALVNRPSVKNSTPEQKVLVAHTRKFAK
ncbi:hypothetical protein BGZ65_011895, partial [Modicella reniformis]